MRRPVAALWLKFNSCNSLLSSVHILLVNILRCVRLHIKRKYYYYYYYTYIVWSSWQRRQRPSSDSPLTWWPWPSSATANNWRRRPSFLSSSERWGRPSDEWHIPWPLRIESQHLATDIYTDRNITPSLYRNITSLIIEHAFWWDQVILCERCLFIIFH